MRVKAGLDRIVNPGECTKVAVNLYAHTSKQIIRWLTTKQKIYATLEERKERNRQAQATFRERRIIYVAQLEKTIQEQRDELRRLQDSCSSATDERLNLKYKNSLLERILLEKGELLGPTTNLLCDFLLIRPFKVLKSGQSLMLRCLCRLRKHPKLDSHQPGDQSLQLYAGDTLLLHLSPWICLMSVAAILPCPTPRTLPTPQT
jgi:hypothetical protein